MRTWITTTLLATLIAVAAIDADDRKFYRDDPVWVDRDDLDTPTKPARVAYSDLYDRFHHTFGSPGSDRRREAANVNTLDQVPDSSWFTNRHGRTRLSVEALARGPNRDDGPDPRTIWTIIGGKQGGLTPGFEILDATGVRYVIKLDPVGLPELSSAAEVIATKLFHAIGYHVPENHIVEVHPETLTIAPDATLEDAFGREHRLTERWLRQLLRSVPRSPNGTVRVTASRYLDGGPLGPFRYYGTRSDDPNDVIPHEDRRELRGLRLFAAWMNHDDVRAQNTQDMWVADHDRRYVKHHLIDFGSTFGSGSVDLQSPNLGFHYWLEPALVRKNALGFGFHTPRYRTVEWPHYPAYASVGRFEADAFDPEAWKPDYPNPAFVRMTPRDAFWAAKIIAAFTREDLAAIVDTGQFSDPAQRDYFVETLVARRQKILERYLVALPPLDGFRVMDDRLRFRDLAAAHLAVSETRYRVQWSAYEDATRAWRPITSPTSTSGTSASLPREPLAATEYLVAAVSAEHRDYPDWAAPVRIYLRRQDQAWTVLSIEVQSPSDPSSPAGRVPAMATGS